MISWQSNGMHYSSKEDSPQECSVVKECAFNIIIDDLDALEMIAPDSRAARMFMSKLLSPSMLPSPIYWKHMMSTL